MSCVCVLNVFNIIATCVFHILFPLINAKCVILHSIERTFSFVWNANTQWNMGLGEDNANTIEAGEMNKKKYIAAIVAAHNGKGNQSRKCNNMLGIIHSCYWWNSMRHGAKVCQREDGKATMTYTHSRQCFGCSVYVGRSCMQKYLLANLEQGKQGCETSSSWYVCVFFPLYSLTPYTIQVHTVQWLNDFPDTCFFYRVEKHTFIHMYILRSIWYEFCLCYLPENIIFAF